MDIFNLHRRVVDDYAQYATSFLDIRDPRIHAQVEQEVKEGAFWPDPLIQLNPNFQPGAWIDEMVAEGLLHPECANIFRAGKDRGQNRPIRLHQHQLDAVRVAQSGHNYVLTTGTGSGKSLAYILPIVDHVLRYGSGKGIQAIIIYPMNALANSQMGELEKFLAHGYPKPPVTFAKYTGQESEEQRRAIIAHPPDILLTNYVMLELVLTRTRERQLIEGARGLRFLVLDELHTYRGRQGADVALLARRVRERLDDGSGLQMVGTSATLASEGTLADQQAQNAAVATQLFGAPVAPEHVIGETLRRATAEPDLDASDYIAGLRQRVEHIDESPPPVDYDAFAADPLSRWLESAFGVKHEPPTGALIRRAPRSIAGAASELANLTGLPEMPCKRAIQAWLMAGCRVAPNPETGQPPFAFRLHQFISPGDSVYASIEPEDVRYITVRGQRYVPGSGKEKILFPVVFCRECGQEFYSVRLMHQPEGEAAGKIVPRDFRDRQSDDESEAGYFYLSTENPWPHDIEAATTRLPDDWLEEGQDGLRVKRHRRDRLPRHLHVLPSGEQVAEATEGVFLGTPFLFCPRCGVAYSARMGDFGKLTTLNSEGRSSATSIISLSTILALREAGEDDPDALPARARKLLSFTDNRQDAALQAGHFNDLVDIGMLRGALYRAVAAAGEAGLRHDVLPERVFDALNLPLKAYAINPEVRFQLLEDTRRALREVLGYRLYLDLRRGWRVTSPNLEQTGLLTIDYLSLQELSEAGDIWAGYHPALAEATPATRAEIIKVLLDYMRRELAIHIEYLDSVYQERIKRRSGQRLAPEKRWAIDENERMEHAAVLFPRSQRAKDSTGDVFVSSRGGFGQYLRRPGTFPGHHEQLRMDDTDRIIPELLAGMRVAGLVREAMEPAGEGDLPGYQLSADVMVWRAGDGTPFHDPIRTPSQSEAGGDANEFFRRFYTSMAEMLHGMKAREHTAQVQYRDREDREGRFRSGDLPVLYCSPTMELGVDIAELNVVNMRNVPPTPANYAQRSGRAGRSGQPALVITYCSAGSPHDQYFFRRPAQMVAGAVAPPRLDLANEDLVRAHVQAIWLAESGINLGETLRDLLDLSGDTPSLELLSDVRDSVLAKGARERAFNRANRILVQLKDDLEAAHWYYPEWLSDVLRHIDARFDRTCDRWRGLYRAALAQARTQTGIIHDASRPHQDKAQAKRLRREAEAQLSLLTEIDRVAQSDFYSYRYFATEGFLPGYSFPRLPVSAYIPARRGRDTDEFLSRPRFLAISEFGPRAIIYHEGSRYIINQVIMPVEGDEEPLTGEIKQCAACGYMHPVTGEADPDVCERCTMPLDPPMRALMRMQNVVTLRRDRISSDEEERQRMGYEIKTGMRFATREGRRAQQFAEVKAGDAVVATLEYGHAATLWRVNLGWARRKNKDLQGFVLDIERGYWAKSQEETEDDQSDPLSRRTRRVIPYVEDRRSCLLFVPASPLEPDLMRSLEMALKGAIEALYQLENNELATEPLPTGDAPRLILFYEAAEGGAGVLRRLIETPDALSQVAAEALRICHYDPDTGNDLGHAPGAKERCEAACYECLLSYSNQRVHDLLDRHIAVEWLRENLLGATAYASPTTAPRSEHVEALLRLCESDLERQWLAYLDDRNLRLPDEAQVYIEPCQTRADFVYREQDTVIYIDGPHHDDAHRQEEDARIERCLRNLGVTVLRFGYRRETWDTIVEQNRHVFGGDI